MASAAGGEVEALARAAGLSLTAAEIETLRATLERSQTAMADLRATIGTADEPATRFSPSPSDHAGR